MPTAAGSRRGWSTAIRISCSPAIARASSSSACRARPTNRSRAPAAASCRPYAQTREADEDALLAQSLPRARALLRRRRRPRSRSSPATGSISTTSARCCASRGGSAMRSASACAPPSSARMRCRRNSPAAPTITSTTSAHWLPAVAREGLVDAVDAFCERIGFTPAQTRRVFEAARALGLPVKLHADQLSDLRRRGAGGGIRRAVRRPCRAHHRRRRARDGRRRHRRGAAARRLPRAARNETAADRRVPRARRADGGRDRLQSRHLAAAVAAPGDAAGLHALPADAGRSAARCDGATRARALGLHDRGMLRVGLRADFVRLAGRDIRPSCATGSAVVGRAVSSEASAASFLAHLARPDPPQDDRAWCAYKLVDAQAPVNASTAFIDTLLSSCLAHRCLPRAVDSPAGTPPTRPIRAQARAGRGHRRHAHRCAGHPDGALGRPRRGRARPRVRLSARAARRTRRRLHVDLHLGRRRTTTAARGRSRTR